MKLIKMYNPSFPLVNTSQNANSNPSSHNSNSIVSYNTVSYNHGPEFGLLDFNYPMFGDNYTLFQELEPLSCFDTQGLAVKMITTTQEMAGISYGSSSSSHDFVCKDLSKLGGDWPSSAKAEGSSMQNRHTEHKKAIERAKMDGHAVTFRTLSEYENLDDGYKWRKYGKKMLKTSTNPRNYYKCSNEGCKVKKRVEREGEDHRYVLTTYEGIHNHQNPSLTYSCNTLLSGWIWKPSSNLLM